MGGVEQRGNQSILGSNLYCPALQQTQGVGRLYEVSTSCDLDWTGAQESTSTVFFLANTIINGLVAKRHNTRFYTEEVEEQMLGGGVLGGNGFQEVAK